MDKNYIKFIIAYDFAERLGSMDLACDEAYGLAEEIATRYLDCVNEEDRCYETLHDFCEQTSFKLIWKELRTDARGLKYTVVFLNSFDSEMPTYLFEDLESAKDFLKKAYEEEVRVQTEENEWEVTASIASDGWSAKITNQFGDVTEYRVGVVYE